MASDTEAELLNQAASTLAASRVGTLDPDVLTATAQKMGEAAQGVQAAREGAEETVQRLSAAAASPCQELQQAGAYAPDTSADHEMDWQSFRRGVAAGGIAVAVLALIFAIAVITLVHQNGQDPRQPRPTPARAFAAIMAGQPPGCLDTITLQHTTNDRC